MTRSIALRAAPARVLAVALMLLGALTLAACGDTVQDQPVAANSLEQLVMVRATPVYWLGGSFHGLQIGEAGIDPGGAFTIQYGDCTEGGQNTCVYPLSIVTSPDNSFRPGGDSARRLISLRGVSALSSADGRTIELATGGVVVDVYGESPALALAAVNTMVPINRIGTPGEPLPVALRDTGFAARALPSQKPPVVSVPRPLGTAKPGAGAAKSGAF
jgi:hypothetical protein